MKNPTRWSRTMLRCIITATADSFYASPTASSSSPQRYDSSCHLDYRHASIKTTLCSNEQSARLVSEGHIPRHLSLSGKRLFLFDGLAALHATICTVVPIGAQS